MAQSIGRTAFFDKTYDEALALTERAGVEVFQGVMVNAAK